MSFETIHHRFQARHPEPVDGGRGRNSMNVLISSGGRRVGLTKCFRESMAELGLNGRIIGIDATPYSSIAYFTDAFYTVPACTEQTFIPALKQICEREKVH